MPPPKKVHLDRAAWSWAETTEVSDVTEDHIKSAYRVTVQPCKIGSCRRNCRGNPFCLSGLGESKWFGEQKESSEDDDVDIELRETDSFVGLKNLGATCYVNSLLQLWFHNLAFRNGILLWDPKEDPLEALDTKIENDHVQDVVEPRTAVGHLQLLFALMQFSRQKSIDPSGFIRSLNLEPSMQQDAQEFSKLFISLLEDNLGQQSNPLVQNLIVNNFRGEYSYITRCSNCMKESVSPSMFYELELNVKGNKTLHESLQEFLKEEYLDGTNMYSCRYCQDKQEASRFIRLDKLPPVLNLQLMRFIYDRQKGHKKKLNTCIQFPDSLDMSPYLNPPDKEKVPVLYNLSAVLIHKGPSAYSGHYIAHICDQTSGTWYKFNDEHVEKMEGKKLKLGANDDDEEGSKKVKQPRLAKGLLASSNAYMLVYTAAGCQEANKIITEANLQSHLRKQIEVCNRYFEQLILDAKERKKMERCGTKALRGEIVSLLYSLPVEQTTDFEKWEIIPSSWLVQWLGNVTAPVQPIDNTKIVCSHNKLNPNCVTSAKYINRETGNILFEKYSGGPRLIAVDSLCKDCVLTKCKGIRFRYKIAEDAKEITSLLKQKEELYTQGFWVGKRSLKSWRRKAVQIFTSDREEQTEKLYNENEHCLSPSNFDVDMIVNSDTKATVDSPVVRSVNTCDHNELCSCCENSRESQDQHSSVSHCDENDSITVLLSIENIVSNVKSKWWNELITGTVSQEFLSDLKSLYSEWIYFGEQLNNIYEKNVKFFRKETNNGNSNVNLCENYKHSNGTVKGAKRKRDDADMKEDGESGDEEKQMKADEQDDFNEEFNEDIICVHDKLVHETNSRRLIPQAAWEKFKVYFPSAREFQKDAEICSQCQSLASEGQAIKDLYKQQALSQKELLPGLLFRRNRPKLSAGTFHVVSVSEFLKPWRRFVRDAGRMEPLYSIRNKTLLCKHNLLLFDRESENDVSNLAALTDDEWTSLSGLYEIDQAITVTYEAEGVITATSPSVCEECLNDKKEHEQKALLQYDNQTIYIRPINHKVDSDDGTDHSLAGQDNKAKGPRQNGASELTETSIRRSTRHRKVRGERQVTISSSDTLRDLKLKILHSLGVAPFDQHLSTENGRDLTDSAATLSSLGIFPRSILFLKVDEPPEDSVTPVDDYIKTSEPEEGFKGTVLLKR
ncbi:ubiquitin carboxyl-terminal hydrolase 48-like isoform X1 [Cimex lectularius]|uniref:Ubiquitin carboxyl-terminal hydrolase 48 n=1 Tax=Cimex lectularius TaxID=79782 RepID=A0A8I6RPN9_CIMLE|nr:ubiquitin carboxyl-terminal hydrolase 48-like isoform X1 [Cimex lectularius]